MDKRQFVEFAPAYYALAIIDVIQRNHTVTREDIDKQFSYNDEFGDEQSLLEYGVLFELATKWLLKRGMVVSIPDHFGPTVYQAAADSQSKWDEQAADESSPFHRWNMIGNKPAWLRSALVSVNEAYRELKISEADFENPDAEWEPLPLDRDGDAQLQAAISAIDSTIEQVRTDNGYNATVPEERNYVLDRLSDAARTLKGSATTTVLYIKTFALEPLMIIARRYKGAALGLVTATAIETLKEWLKQKGVTWLDGLF